MSKLLLKNWKRKFWYILLALLISMGLLILLRNSFRITTTDHAKYGNMSVSAPEAITNDFIKRKTEMMLKEYDSTFSVIDRETAIINGFRGWAITLLGLCFTLLLGDYLKANNLFYVSILIVFMTFYILEVAERSIILNMLHELRDLEKIFDIKRTDDFYRAVSDYKFRDIQDQSRQLINNNVFIAAIDRRVVVWNLFLIGYLILIKANYNVSEKKEQSFTFKKEKRSS